MHLMVQINIQVLWPGRFSGKLSLAYGTFFEIRLSNTAALKVYNRVSASSMYKQEISNDTYALWFPLLEMIFDREG